MVRAQLMVGIPLAPLRNFGEFIYPTLPVSIGRDAKSKSRRSLPASVNARGSKISHTWVIYYVQPAVGSTTLK